MPAVLRMFVQDIVANRIGTTQEDAPTTLRFLRKDILFYACESGFIATNCASVTSDPLLDTIRSVFKIRACRLCIASCSKKILASDK
jgi:hypothetical protein